MLEELRRHLSDLKDMLLPPQADDAPELDELRFNRTYRALEQHASQTLGLLCVQNALILQIGRLSQHCNEMACCNVQLGHITYHVTAT